jgi:uncharacterized membrane protein (UPF0127 family)
LVAAGLLIALASACTDRAATPPATTHPATAAPTTHAAVTMPPATVPAATVPASTARGTRPQGFDRVLARVTTAGGELCEVCLWLAATAEQRQRGLMHVTDLGDADGMAFVYEAPHTGAFWMKNTLLPLSIGFYAGDGGYLGTFDMQPCTADPCPSYPTPIDFTVAIETELGRLSELGIGPGSTLELTDLACT